MKLPYKAFIVTGATAVMMLLSQGALAMASTNCGRIQRALQADQEQLRICRRGGGTCGWIEADIEKMQTAYQNCLDGKAVSSDIYKDPGMRPKPQLREFQR